MIHPHILPKSTAKKYLHVRNTHYDYIASLCTINPNIEPIETYVGNKVKIKHICKKCFHAWMVTPSNTLKGRGCPKCKKKNLSIQHTLSQDEYIERLVKKNPSYILLGHYKNQKTKTSHKCLICGYIWDIAPSNLLSNVGGCPNCKKEKSRKRHTLSQKEFYDRLRNTLNPNIQLNGQYVNMKTPIEYKCLNGHLGKMFPESILRGCNCRKCVDIEQGNAKQKSHDDYVNIIKTLHPNVTILSKYQGASQLIRFQVDGEDFVHETTASALYHASTWNGTYKGEERISNFLDKNNIKYQRNKRYPDLRGKRNPLSYDFYLTDYNILIEYQGEQHSKSIDLFGGDDRFAIQQKYDFLKRKYAFDNNIKLIEIWYYEYNYIEEILTSKLKLDTIETAG